MGLCCFHMETFHSCDESVTGDDKGIKHILGVTLTVYEIEEKSGGVTQRDDVRQKKGLTEEGVRRKRRERADVASETQLEVRSFACLLIETSQLRPLRLKVCYQQAAACYGRPKKEKKK